MMRKKIFIGLLVAALIGLAAGDYVFNRSGAQDAPKKAEPDGKLTFPPLPGAPTTLPPVVDGPKSDLPVATQNALPEPPGLNPPPSVAPEEKNTPAKDANDNPPPLPPPANKYATPQPGYPLQSAFEPKKADPMPVSPVKKPEKLVDPPRDARFETTGYPKQAFAAQDDPKQRNCPWTLQVAMLDGQTIVTATVNKKHEFKIVCQSLDLQTGKGTLKAVGKVQISGDMMTGTCEQLAISLHDDRLLLEGGAEVHIQKAATHVSHARPAAFELKGETLNLRISELEAGKITQTGWQATRPSAGSIKPLAVPADSKQWTPFGTLRTIKSVDNPSVRWCLENNAGEVIAYLVANEGRTLEAYVGRSISVLGIRESEEAGHPVLRVTHIALP